MKDAEHTQSARQLLDSAKDAAKIIRRENGWLARIVGLIERREEQRHELALTTLKHEQQEEIRKRCRSNQHDTQGWQVLHDTKTYAAGSKVTESSIPVNHQRTWLGHCIHCGAPQTRAQNL